MQDEQRNDTQGPDTLRGWYSWQNEVGETEYSEDWIIDACINPSTEHAEQWADLLMAALDSGCGNKVPGQELTAGAMRRKDADRRRGRLGASPV